MSTSAYAKFYVFDQDKEFLRGQPKDVYVNTMKNCHEMNEWDDELSSLDFFLPKEVFAKVKDLGFVEKDGHENDTIRHKLLGPEVESIGFISPEAKIKDNENYIESDDRYVLVNDMFDSSPYRENNRNLIVSCIHEDKLKEGWKVLYRRCYQYDGIWLNRVVLEDASSKYEKELEEAYSKLFELKSLEKEIKYGNGAEYQKILKELEELKKVIKSKDKNCYSDTEYYDENETALGRWNDDFNYTTEKINELKYKIQAVNQLLGMAELVYADMEKSYNDEIYIWLYLC